MKTNNSTNIQKTTKDIAAATLATAAGAAAGTTASAAIIQHIDDVVIADSDDVEASAVDDIEHTDAHDAKTAAHTHTQNYTPADGAAHIHPSATIAPDAELIDTSEVEVEDADAEIHVIGVEAVDNGMGGMAIVAALESEGETALIADIDADGIMDVFVYDADGNGAITEDEIQDISAAEVGTEDVIDAYQMENLAQQNLMDGPDYINDADTAYFDA